MMNTWNGIGRLTRDVEFKYSQNGTAFLKGTIAINRRFNKEEADFIPFTMFGKGAEIFSEYTKKGDQVGLEGRIQTGRYDNDEGKTIYTVDVIVENFTFLGGGNSQGQSSGNNQPTTQTGQKSTNKGNNEPFKNEGAPIDISDDDLPF